VGANGLLTAGPQTGGVLASGDFAVVAGQNMPGSSPGIWFLVR
jgi:hypothetical protein